MNGTATSPPPLRSLKRGLAVGSAVVFAVLFGLTARHAAGSNGSAPAPPATSGFFDDGEDYGFDGTPTQGSPPAAQSRVS
jgi:hypothetical protein